MNDSIENKTQIKPSLTANASEEDKTRFAPMKKTAIEDDERTRIQLSKPKNTTPSSDRTRFIPQQKVNPNLMSSDIFG